MIIAGADPGFDGAIAFINVEGMKVVAIVDVPTAKKKSGRREIDLHRLIADCIGALDGKRCGHLYQERLNSFAPAGRKMGTASAFSLGECSMAVRMLAACNGWPTTLIGPAQWKRAFSLGPDKAQARLRASELLPDDAHLWTPKRGKATLAQANGRAESVLLALFGIRTLHSTGGPMKAETSNSAIGPTAARNYFELALEQEQQARELVQRKMPGEELPPALKPGVVPRHPSVWDADRDPVPTIDASDPDPSGTVLP